MAKWGKQGAIIYILINLPLYKFEDFALFSDIMFILILVSKYSFKNKIMAVVDIYFECPYISNNKMEIIYYSFNNKMEIIYHHSFKLSITP